MSADPSTGYVADRLGRTRVFVTGYAMLLLVYGLLLVPEAGALQLVACLVLFGAYYAATDGILMAIAGSLLPKALLGTGLALLVTATSLGRLVSAVAFGALWSWAAPETAVAVFAGGLALALIVVLVTFARTPRDPDVRVATG